MQTHEFTTGQIRPIECVKEAWSLIKDEYWLLFAISIVGGIIAGFTVYVLLGAMICGIFRCYLTKLDGGKVKFDDLWSGFKYFWPSLLVTILFVAPIVIYFVAVFSTMYLPIIMKAIGGSRVSDEEMLATVLIALVVDVVVAIVMVAIHSLLMFSFPLIVDRGLSSMEAIRLSARATLKNIGGVGGLIVVNFGLVILGYLAFCVGLYLVIPLITAGNLVAYRKVFPAINRPPSILPPPPSSYPDLAAN
jgi:hypothetical protein